MICQLKWFDKVTMGDKYIFLLERYFQLEYRFDFEASYRWLVQR